MLPLTQVPFRIENVSFLLSISRKAYHSSASWRKKLTQVKNFKSGSMLYIFVLHLIESWSKLKTIVFSVFFPFLIYNTENTKQTICAWLWAIALAYIHLITIIAKNRRSTTAKHKFNLDTHLDLYAFPSSISYRNIPFATEEHQRDQKLLLL